MKQEYGTFRVMAKMITLITPLMGLMSIAVIMGVLGFLCAIFLPVSGAYFILIALHLVNEVALFQVALFMMIIALLRGVLHYLEQRCNHDIAFRLLAILRDKIFTKLRELAPAKLEGKEKGNLITLITSDIELLEVFYAHTISPILIAVITCMILLVIFAQFHILYMGIAFVAYVWIGLILPWRTTKKGKESGNKCRQALGDLSTYTLESIRGLREILQYDQGEERMHTLHQKSDRVNELQKILRKIEGNNASASGFSIHFFSLLLLFCGLGLYAHGAVSFANIFLSTVLILSSFGPVLALSNVSNNLLLTIASGRRVIHLLEEESVIQEVTGKKRAQSGDMRFDHTSFAYGEELILDDVNECFPKGSISGILGKSGSGKSTMLKLMMRFYDPQRGHVMIDDRDLKDINTGDLRGMQSYVTQETVMFHDTIANNIRIAKLDATQEEIELACRKANLHDFILSLQDGYDTLITELGDSLSGGEKQRIALARAFLHDGAYIFLDEPTSNLDVLNESIILKSLKETSGKTIILVSHRPSTMSICDNVHHMAEGRIS